MNYKLGLIGYPIQHSLSPWIHETFLNQSKIKGTYSLMEIKLEHDFSEAMKHLKAEQFHGFNITVPYKEKIMPYLDDIDEVAQHIGAVNTVLRKGNQWIGYNTDGIGYVRSLQSAYPELNDLTQSKILILGAGGAAKGIYTALVNEGAKHITIANRTIENAENIIANQRNQTDAIATSLADVEQSLEMFDIIIQTSSVGMKPHVNESIITLNHLKNNVIVSDIVYQPLLTHFLQQAQNQKARIHYGHTMLLYQAQYAFEIWTNQNPQIGTMDEQLLQLLEG